MKILILLFPLFIAGCEQNMKSAKSAVSQNLVFGDSIANGAGASDPSMTLTSCLTRQLKRPFLNKGVDGDTTRGMLSRLPGLLALQPRIVVFSGGGNDLLMDLRETPLGSSVGKHAFPAEETLSNLEKIFASFQSVGAKVFYINMNPPLTIKNVKTIPASIDGRLAAVKDLAARYPNVVFVAGAMEGLWLNSELMSDDIHPNNKGYALMCERLAAQIR